MNSEPTNNPSPLAKESLTLKASLLSVPTARFIQYIPSTADAYHKVREIGCVETQNICVKKMIVPPKNIPCFDAHSNKVSMSATRPKHKYDQTRDHEYNIKWERAGGCLQLNHKTLPLQDGVRECKNPT